MCVVYSAPISLGQSQGLEHDRGPVLFPATSELYNIALYIMFVFALNLRVQPVVRAPRRAAAHGLRIRVPSGIDHDNPALEQPHPGGRWGENALLNRNNPAIVPPTVPVNMSVPYERVPASVASAPVAQVVVSPSDGAIG